MKYSSPLALLNRYFKKAKKFKYIAGEDEYENTDFVLQWIEEEKFILNEIVRDWDTNSIDLKEVGFGELTDCVEKMRKYYKTGEI